MKTKGKSYWKKKVWKEFSRYIRLRDCLKTTNFKDSGKCITCGRVYPFKQLQAGHFIPGRNNQVLFDEEQVNAQCYSCNVGLKGNWPSYLKIMVERHGQDKVDLMLNEHMFPKVYEIEDYQELYKLYKDKADKLESGFNL